MSNKHTVKSQILSTRISEYLQKCTLCNHHPNPGVSLRVQKLLVGGWMDREIMNMSPSCHLFLELSSKDVKKEPLIKSAQWGEQHG